jgi:hypothetical protein
MYKKEIVEKERLGLCVNMGYAPTLHVRLYVTNESAPIYLGAVRVRKGLEKTPLPLLPFYVCC